MSSVASPANEWGKKVLAREVGRILLATRNTTEGLATDSGSEIFLAHLVVETVRVVSTGELIVGEGGG